MNYENVIQLIPKRREAMSFTGYFTVRAIDYRNGRVRHLASFANLILDQGLERLGASNINPTHAQVGSGTTTPANNQTSLTTFKAGTARTSQSSVAYVAGPPAYVRRVYTYEFGTGNVVGNVSEIGVGFSAAAGPNLTSRALILDNFGVPTTLTVLSTESLIITYELRLYPNVTDYTISGYNIGGVATDILVRPSRITTTSVQGWSIEALTSDWAAGVVTDYSGTVGTVDSTPSGTTATGATATLAAYSATSRVRDMQLSWGPSAGLMAGGVGAIAFGMQYAMFQAQFTPKLTKTNTQTRVLTFRFPWARAS